MLGLDVSPDGREIVTDLLGQLWLVPSGGGPARAITDAVADTADDQDPSFSPDGRRIAFSAERAGKRGLWMFEPGVGSPVLLYELPDPSAFAGDASWSPDGRRVAFARIIDDGSRPGSHRSRIALLDPDTRVSSMVAIAGLDSAILRHPVWMPDGGRIAFVARLGAVSRMWLVSSSGGAATPLTAEYTRLSGPAFSPDGQRIAYIAADTAGSLQVCVQDMPGGATQSSRCITDHADIAGTRVRWSADGGSLYYSADGKLWRVASAGGTPVEIPFTAHLTVTRPRLALPPARFPEPGETQPARGFMGLALSPDGTRIGLIALSQLWVVPVGGEPRAVTDVPHTARYAAWSPDGAEIAWSAGPAREQDVFATDLSSGLTRRVTALAGRELYPSYSPDGKWIAFVHSDSTTRLRVIPARGGPVSDQLQTRDLGRTEASWSGSDVSADQWDPTSDGLLRHTDWEREENPRGEILMLSGGSSEVRMPNAPNFLRWTRDGIIWTRHDRLWTAPFTRQGMVGEPRPVGDAAAMYPSVARDGTVLYVSEGGLRVRSPEGAERIVGWPVSYQPRVPPALLVRNVRIIDGTGAPATEPRDLLIERGRISRIDAAGSLAQRDVQVLDAAGGFAIPGLMDLHAHTYLPELLPGFLYFGVTLVRDQGSDMAPLVAYADMIAAGVIPGPRVSYGGFQFYSDWPFDEEQGRGIEPEVDRAHVARAMALAEAFGSHHIKIRTFRRWDIASRMIREAHRRGMRATGHCVQQLPLVAAGIDAKEHAGACGPRYGTELLYDDVAQLARAAGNGVVPTISYLALAARLSERPDLLDGDAELAPFMPPKSNFEWMLRLTPTQRQRWARDADGARRTALRLAQAGVAIGTGTDVWQIPIGVHMEMAELVAAGLTPSDAIRTATSGAARIVGVERDLGTIEVGKLADLVILSVDPLADIRNTRRIYAVIQGGHIVDRAGIRTKYRVHR